MTEVRDPIVTRADLSREALAAISPDLTLTILAELSGIDLGHLSRMASGHRTIGPRVGPRLATALDQARELALQGRLARLGSGRRRRVKNDA